MIRLLISSLPFFLSLLVDPSLAQSGGHHRHHHLPDTVPDMDLKPAFQRTTTAAPPHHHSHHHTHDFSLPLPGRTHRPEEEDSTVPYKYDYNAYETEPFGHYTEVMTEMDPNTSGDYEVADQAEVGDEGKDSHNDQLAGSASENKFKSTLLLVLTIALLILIT